MSANKAQGLNDIPAWLLSAYTEEFSEWFSHLFTLSLRIGLVHHQYLKGQLLFISEDSSIDPAKFRPITILSRVTILYKKVLLGRLSSELNTNTYQGASKVATNASTWQASYMLSSVASAQQVKSSRWPPSTLKRCSTASAFQHF